MGGLDMERDYLEWINKSYGSLIKNKELKKLEINVPDGKISVYRVKDVIRVDVKREETKC